MAVNISSVFIGILLTLSVCMSYATDTIKIGVVGKTKNDSFYYQSYQGCLHFAKAHPEVRCIYDGGNDFQDIRAQAIILNKLIAQGVDGLLLSTTDSDFVVNRALSSPQAQYLPVITFDSDLLPKHYEHRLSYVGTDNFNFGQALGRYAKKLKKEELTRICLQSGHSTSPNLNERLAGVRYELAGEKTDRLRGKNGWVEHDRCPFYSLGKRDDALAQLEAMLRESSPPFFIAVAGFAQFNPNYIKRLAPYRKDIESGSIVIISADTESTQIEALDAGLSTINIGQNPFEMGRLGTELLYNYITKKERPSQEKYYLDYHYCRLGETETCMGVP